MYGDFAGREEEMPLGLDPKVSEECVDEWLPVIREFLQILAARKKRQFDRRISIGDLLTIGKIKLERMIPMRAP